MSSQSPPPVDERDDDALLDLHAAAMEDEGAPTPPQGVNWGVLVALVVAMAAVSFLVFDGLKAETYFYTVDQAVARGPDLAGEHVRIKGVVETGSVEGTAGQLGHRFRISEQGKSLTVTFDKALPDTFKEGSEVVAHGEVNERLVLEADEVLVKCPSRYEGQPPTATPEGISPQASR